MKIVLFVVLLVALGAVNVVTAASTKAEPTTDGSVLYLLKGSTDRTEITATTSFAKLLSKKTVNDTEEKPVVLKTLSHIQCPKKPFPNDNMYPRVAITGPGSFITNDKEGNLILGNTEISGVIFTVKDLLVIFPTLTTGFTSEKIWYEMPFGHVRSQNTHPTTLIIDGSLAIPQKNAVSKNFRDSNSENCGSISQPSIDFVRTDVIVNGYFYVGMDSIGANGEPRFYADKGTIMLEDSSLKVPTFTSEATFKIAGKVNIEATKVSNKYTGMLGGNLAIACKDTNHASEWVCNQNDTVLNIKGDIALAAKTTFSLAFDPNSKEFSIGHINIEKGAYLSKTVISLADVTMGYKIEKFSTEEQNAIFNQLTHQKFLLIKNKTPIKHLPKLDLSNLLKAEENNILKQLQKRGKTFALSYDEKTFSILLSVVDSQIKKPSNKGAP